MSKKAVSIRNVVLGAYNESKPTFDHDDFKAFFDTFLAGLAATGLAFVGLYTDGLALWLRVNYYIFFILLVAGVIFVKLGAGTLVLKLLFSIGAVVVGILFFPERFVATFFAVATILKIPTIAHKFMVYNKVLILYLITVCVVFVCEHVYFYEVYPGIYAPSVLAGICSFIMFMTNFVLKFGLDRC